MKPGFKRHAPVYLGVSVICIAAVLVIPSPFFYLITLLALISLLIYEIKYVQHFWMVQIVKCVIGLLVLGGYGYWFSYQFGEYQRNYDPSPFISDVFSIRVDGKKIPVSAPGDHLLGKLKSNNNCTISGTKEASEKIDIVTCGSKPIIKITLRGLALDYEFFTNLYVGKQSIARGDKITDVISVLDQVNNLMLDKSKETLNYYDTVVAMRNRCGQDRRFSFFLDSDTETLQTIKLKIDDSKTCY